MNETASWQALQLNLSSKTLAELIDGGQAFRWNSTAPNIWKGVWSHHVIEIQIQESGSIDWRSLTPGTRHEDIINYLGPDDNWAERFDQLPWRSDPVLNDAMQAFPGLRILRQPLSETLLGFLCSSNKQILQIKAMLEALSQFGHPLIPGVSALPTWDELAKTSLDDLKACKLGYRARYISETAKILTSKPDWESEVVALPYPEAHAWLCQLSGVGPKVADCVLLFGAAKLEAFPIDTWILRILRERYALEDLSQKQLQSFARVHFGRYAGLAQQYLFATARSTKS